MGLCILGGDWPIPLLRGSLTTLDGTDPFSVFKFLVVWCLGFLHYILGLP